MKLLFTGKIDNLGRLLLPENVRTAHNLANGEEVCVYEHDGMLCLKRATPSCIFCSITVDESSKTVRGKYVCDHCALEFR